MNKPQVSIIIPTYNSEKTLEICLDSILKQTYANIEVIVVDSFSSDKTKEIAEKQRCRVVTTRGRLLAARYKGFLESRGEFVLMLDSDQILASTTIARSLEMLKTYDMLCLEEKSYAAKTWIQFLFEADRRLVHDLSKEHLDPVEGVLLARVYKRRLLKRAFESIPKEIMPLVVAHDHAIIYYEAYKISRSVRILSNAVWHKEPASLMELWKKNYRYGKTTKELIQLGFYENLLNRKVRFRKGALSFGNWKNGLLSYLLLVLKGLAYQLGYTS